MTDVATVKQLRQEPHRETWILLVRNSRHRCAPILKRSNALAHADREGEVGCIACDQRRLGELSHPHVRCGAENRDYADRSAGQTLMGRRRTDLRGGAVGSRHGRRSYAGFATRFALLLLIAPPRENLSLHALSARFPGEVGSSRVDLQACKLEYSIVSPK